MPRRGKRPQLKLIQAQKKFIESRLMQISLTVDNYIYKNIPITAANAVIYLKEITGYKAMCLQNQRSLQVIEKLFRIMSRIIEEDKDLQHSQADVEEDINDMNLVDTHTVTAAPVDEDLTQLSQEDIERNVESPTIIQSNNVAKTSKDKTYKENMRNNIDKFLTTTLRKDISKLQICDTEDPKLATNCFQECSQSILENFESVNTFQNRDVNVTKRSIDFVEVIKPVTIDKKYNTRGIKRPIPKIIYRKRVDRVTASKIAHNQPEQEVTSSKNKKVVEEKPNEETDGAVKRKCNKSVGKQNKQSAKRKTMRAKEDIEIKDLNQFEASQKYKFPNTFNTYSMTKTTKEPEQDKIALENITNAVETQSNLMHINNENPVSIYNKEVANDLSWIENIRFVREISKEEYFPAYFDESFWNDYSLPPDFNEKEFLH